MSISMKTLLAAAIGAALAATGAHAADVAARPYVKAPVAAPNWTGWYGGLNAGGGWTDTNVDYSANDPLTTLLFGGPLPLPARGDSVNASGALGGLQFGYNYQFQRNWMVGIETDFQFAGIRGSGATTYTVNAGQAVTAVNQEIEYFGTVRARLGYLPTDQLLVYATGGFAYAQLNNAASMSASAPGINANLPSGGTIYSVNCGNGFPDTCFASSSSRLSPGWTVGGGLEYAFWQNWSLKGEYLFARFQDTLTPTAISVIPGGTASTYNAKVTTDLNIVRLGLNYKFSGY